ncbi:MAG: LptA/OstA family protein [Deltaproteobacteria bacterium]|nr:LptA/OstA family protein [Deltaproteobacteria bacterium]
MRAASLALLPLLLLAASATTRAEDAGVAPETAAEVQADRLRVDHGRREARFEGHVRAVYSGLELSCDLMEVSYDERGAVTALRASGRVAVRRGEARATGERAQLDARQGVLVLEGRPVLTQGANRLEGTRITVHLASGKLEVTEARGFFRLGPATGAPK